MRTAGILVHPTALPGPFGIGDLGPSTIRFLDRMAEAGLKVWQLLPVGPTGPDNSPYACRSAFAGNPWLISPHALVHAGWLPPERVTSRPAFSKGRADFDAVRAWKSELLRGAWRHFRARATPAQRAALESFVEQGPAGCWLHDWCVFAAIKNRARGAAWTTWDPELRDRDPSTLARVERELAEEIDFQRFVQFGFWHQWQRLHLEARARDIRILGDVPFYVAHDSADVWVHRELFKLDPAGRPTHVAGVPPDYFSDTGQLWGNPVFDWSRLAETDYAWWRDRIRTNLATCDLLRLDHFRAFSAYWEVEAGASTAVDGRWVPGPGKALFEALRQELGELPFIAEDLGLITDDVEQLRDGLDLPGMYVLQFAFRDGESRHRPEHHRDNAVVYTGTHDNDTTRGWFQSLDATTRSAVLAKLDTDEEHVVWRMIETAFRSPARQAIVPLQDLLGLGSEARMNRPGEPVGNWDWRAAQPGFSLRRVAELRALIESAGRGGSA